MPTIEWVSLNVAVERLRSLWGIPPLIAEDIVRNVIQGGKVDVRAVTLGRLVPQIITEQNSIGAGSERLVCSEL